MKNPVLPAEENDDAKPALTDAGKPLSFSGGAAPGAGDRQATRSLFRPYIFNTPARETSGARAAVEADILSGAAGGIAGEPRDHRSAVPESGGFDCADVCAKPGVAENGNGPRDPEAAIMVRNGITRTPANHYHVDGYRYGNLADALAQVRRGAPERGRGS